METINADSFDFSQTRTICSFGFLRDTRISFLKAMVLRKVHIVKPTLVMPSNYMPKVNKLKLRSTNVNRFTNGEWKSLLRSLSSCHFYLSSRQCPQSVNNSVHCIVYNVHTKHVNRSADWCERLKVKMVGAFHQRRGFLAKNQKSLIKS